MTTKLEKIYPDIVNTVICKGCARENELVVDREASHHFLYMCVCGTTSKYFVVNRREQNRRAVDEFGTCWLEKNQKGITIKMINLSERGLRIEFIGRKAEITPKIGAIGKGWVIYNDGAGKIISHPREILFKNVHGLYVGAEFVTEQDKKEAIRPPPVQKPKECVNPRKPVGNITGRVKCARCGQEIIARAGSYTSIRIRCPNCAAEYLLNMDRRKHARTNVLFPGQMASFEGARYAIQVRNISENGICFSLPRDGGGDFAKEDKLIVSYKKQSGIISGKAIIASISGDKNVHARFKSYRISDS